MLGIPWGARGELGWSEEVWRGLGSWGTGLGEGEPLGRSGGGCWGGGVKRPRGGKEGAEGAGACGRGVKDRDEQLRGYLTGIAGRWWVRGL